MSSFRILFLALALTVGTVGCKSMPDVTVSYYLPKTSVSVHAVRTIACNSAKQVFTTTTVTAAVSHVADPEKRRSVSFKALDGPLSDSDMQLQLYEDGRLKGINSSTTGEAESFIKPLVAVAAAAFGGTEGGPSGLSTGACSFAPDPTKPLTLTFTRELDFADLSGTTPTGAEKLTSDQLIEPDPDSTAVFDKVKADLGYVCIRIEKLPYSHDATGKPIPDKPVTENVSDPAGTVELSLQQPARIALKVWSSPDNTCAFKSDAKLLWTAQTQVAQVGVAYSLPIPKAVLFGKMQFSLALAESGALTTLEYTKQAGAPAATTAANEISGQLTPEAATQKAADLKAEADIIAQQQRLIRCRANPQSCT